MPNTDDPQQQRETSSPNEGVAPPSGGTSNFGNAVYDEIGNHLQQATGRAATQQEVSQWGTNVDANYMSKIKGAISGSSEAQKYAASQAQRQAAPPAANGATSAPPATGSPVNATGQITPAPQQAYLPAPTPAQNGATPNELRYVKPVDMSSVPQYQTTQFSTATPQAYQPGQLPDAYKADQISQYQNPALMKAIMDNPDTMNANVVAQMKEAQKQQALLMQQQQQQGFNQSAAARGVLGGGNSDALGRNLQQNTQGQILDANRNVDITAAQTNRGNELDALGANASQYNTGLQGQMAQAGLNQAASASGLARAQTSEQNQQAAFDSRFRNAGLTLQQQQAQAGENQYGNNSALGRMMQQFQMNQGVATNAQQNYAADSANNLAQNQFRQQNNQFAQNLGLQYDQMDQNGLFNYLNWLNGQGN